MKVNITIPKARKGKFSEIKLGYKNEENEDIQVLLNVDFQNLYEFTRKKNGIGFDVFLMELIFFCQERVFQSMDGLVKLKLNFLLNH